MKCRFVQLLTLSLGLLAMAGANAKEGEELPPYAEWMRANYKDHLENLEGFRGCEKTCGELTDQKNINRLKSLLGCLRKLSEETFTKGEFAGQIKCPKNSNPLPTYEDRTGDGCWSYTDLPTPHREWGRGLETYKDDPAKTKDKEILAKFQSRCSCVEECESLVKNSFRNRADRQNEDSYCGAEDLSGPRYFQKCVDRYLARLKKIGLEKIYPWEFHKRYRAKADFLASRKSPSEQAAIEKRMAQERAKAKAEKIYESVLHNASQPAKPPTRAHAVEAGVGAAPGHN